MLGIQFHLQTCMLHIALCVLHVESACINKNPHKTIKIQRATKHIELIPTKMALLASAQGKMKTSTARKLHYLLCTSNSRRFNAL